MSTPGPDTWRSWTPEPVPVRPRRRQWVTKVLALALIAGVLTLTVPGVRAAITDSPWYSLARGEPERIRPLPPEGQGGVYAFAATHPGDADTPVTYDPCRPIHVVTNASDAPAELDTDRLLQEALAQVSDATGLSFVVDGATTETPTLDRQLRDPGEPTGWSPVLVAWTTPEVIAELDGPVAGIGGSVSITETRGATRHPPRYVSGYAYLDGPAFEQITSALHDPLAWERARAILMHELAHVVGLGHVQHPGELMNGHNTGATAFGPGDLNGLRELGQGDCRPPG